MSSQYRELDYDSLWQQLAKNTRNILETVNDSHLFSFEETYSLVYRICCHNFGKQLLQDLINLCTQYLGHACSNLLLEHEDDVFFNGLSMLCERYHQAVDLIVSVYGYLERTCFARQIQLKLQLTHLFQTIMIAPASVSQRLVAILRALPEQVVLYRSTHHHQLMSIIQHTLYALDADFVDTIPVLFRTFKLNTRVQEMQVAPPVLSLREDMFGYDDDDGRSISDDFTEENEFGDVASTGGEKRRWDTDHIELPLKRVNIDYENFSMYQ